MKIALQLYSVREDAAKDFGATIGAVKAMGYDGVELAGMYGLEPADIRAMLDKQGLEAISAHVPYEELIADMEGTIDRYVTIGCSYIAVPYLMDNLRPGKPAFEEVVANIAKIGKACRDKGVTLLYHNHDFEFEKMPDGRYALDYLYETVPADLLQTEIDTCWVKVAGEDPAGYVRKYAGRSPIVHLKDFEGERGEGMYGLIGQPDSGKQAKKFQFKAVGHGVQDFKAILEASREAGAQWVVVEQDAHAEHTAQEDAKLSIDYLRSINA